MDERQIDDAKAFTLLHSLKLNGEYTEIKPEQLLDAGLTIQELIDRVQKLAAEVGVDLDVNYYTFYVDALPYLYQVRCKINFKTLPVISWPFGFMASDV